MQNAEGLVQEAAPIIRRLPIGAEVLPSGGVSFRVWAPKRREVDVAVFQSTRDRQPAIECPLRRESSSASDDSGYFCGVVREAAAGMFYGLRLDGQTQTFPDPASRYQIEGPTGLSQIVDPLQFKWSDHDWNGVKIEGQAICEVHIGTLTQQGTWSAATARLDDLATAGMTVIEIMPVNEFPGTFGWGYDGVCLFAPTRNYGVPDDFRRFVDRAHSIGLGVILDVVYNHFGSIGSTIAEFSEDYGSRRYKNEWGQPINFDGPNCEPVREFFVANARYWIQEFHLDGFRLDATQQIFDSSEVHIIAEIQEAARRAAGRRSVILIGENEPQDVRLVRPTSRGGFGLDALCNDDFHHTARARLTGLTEAYYEDYAGSVSELGWTVRGGFLYQGQISQHQHKRRGSPSRGMPPTSFVHFLQNHDQIANSRDGRRIHELTSPGRLRAMIALWLLSPQTPMFFQGQNFCASSPFLYFADFSGEDAKAVAEGRRKFLSQFPSFNTPEATASMAEPSDRSTLERSKLDWSECQKHQSCYELHADLLKLRKEDPVFQRQRADRIETMELSADCLAVRYFDGDESDGADRLLVVNFGVRFLYSPSPAPLLAPPAGRNWSLLWGSEHVRYGGRGIPAVETDAGWQIPGEAAVVLQAIEGPTPPSPNG